MALISASLRGGGSERAMVNMANYWAKKGWPITLLVLTGPDEKAAYALHPQVNFLPLGVLDTVIKCMPLRRLLHLKKLRYFWKLRRHILFTIWSNIRQTLHLDPIVTLFAVRRAVLSADAQVTISFIDRMNMNTLLALLGTRRPVVISERVDPAHEPLGRFWKMLRPCLYPFASALVVQTEQVRDYFAAPLRAITWIIPNFISQPTKHEEPQRSARAPTMLAMGRLTQQKGYDILLRAFAQISDKHPEWKLIILGEGAQRDELEKLRDQLQLTQKVQLPGWSAAPQKHLTRADLFVMPSRYEGFPNALCEAMAYGLPAVATAVSGSKTIVRHGVDGFLAPPEDVDALAAVLDEILAQPELRKTMGERAKEITERFSERKIMLRWEQMLEQICV